MTSGLSAPPPSGRLSLWKTRWISVLLLASDAIGLGLCWLGAYLLRWALDAVHGPINPIQPYLVVFPLIMAVGIANCMAFGLYVHRRRLASLNRLSVLMRAGYHWLLYIIVVGFFFKELDLGRSVILLSAVLGFLYLWSSRTLLKTLKRRAIERGGATVRCAVLGTGELAIEVIESLDLHPEIGYTMVGVIDHTGEAIDPRLLEQHAHLGTSRDITRLVEEHGIEELFLAMAHLEIGRAHV